MIVRLWGGLGNQMFCYAFGRALFLRRQEEVLFDRFGMDGNRPYALDPFKVFLRFTASRPTVEWKEKTFAFDPTALEAPANSYLVGHWQTEKYFADELTESILRREFQIKMHLSESSQKTVNELMDTITESRQSCAIHVRRGDYLHPASAEFHGVLPMDYYHEAMEYIAERVPRVRFFVFSDDPAWCRSAFPGPSFTIREGNQDYEDMHLMSFCDHAIIANSSFSWWGAWLGDRKPGRIVIAPKRWFAVDTMDTTDIIPERWVRL